MKQTSEELKQKCKAAIALLSESTTSLERVQSVVGLLKGVNKRLDGLLVVCEKNCKAIELVTTGAYIELAAEHLPEETEDQRKRKKALLLFIRSWGELKSEVARIQADLDTGKQVTDSSFWLSTLSAAKGPLAVITLVAVGIGVMSQTSVDVVITNTGCSTIYGTEIPVHIPGFTLPSGAIEAGESATMTIPPLAVTVDGTSGTSLTLSSLAFTFPIQLSQSVTAVTFDDVPLLGKKTELDLSSRPLHTLTITCRP